MYLQQKYDFNPFYSNSRNATLKRDKTRSGVWRRKSTNMAVTGRVLFKYADSFQRKNRRFSLVTVTKTLIIIEFETSSVDWYTLFEEIRWINMILIRFIRILATPRSNVIKRDLVFGEESKQKWP